jgi:exonuclease SbcC
MLPKEARMLPKRIKIRAIGPYKEQELDLGGVPGDLIAVCGKNGEGKSFLLDSMFAGIYREFPSRPAGVYRYCTDRDAGIEFDFEMNGKIYQSTVMIDSKARKMEAVLAADGQAINDGKTGTFDKEIAKVCGGKAQVLASSYGSQTKSGNFIELEKAQRKDLFIKMIGLTHLQQISDCAKGKAGALEGEKQNLMGRIDSLSEVAARPVPDIMNTQNWKDAVSSELEAANAARDAFLSEISQYTSKTATLPQLEAERISVTKAVSQKNAEIGVNIETISSLKPIADSTEGLKAKIKSDSELLPYIQERLAIISERSSQADQIKNRINTLAIRKVALSADVDAASKSLSYQTSLAENVVQLRSKASDLDQAKVALTECSQEFNRLSGELTTLTNDEREYARLAMVNQSELAKLAQEESLSQTHLERARKDSLFIKGVPCQAEGKYAKCQFLVYAVESTGKIDDYAAAVDNARAGALAVKQEFDQVHKPDREAIKRIQARSDYLKKEIDRLGATVREYERILTKLPEAEAASAKIDLLRAQVDNIQQSLDLVEVDLGQAEAEDKAAAGLMSEITQLRAEVKEKQSAIAYSQSKLKEAEDAASLISSYEAQNRTLNDACFIYANRLNDLTSQIDAIAPLKQKLVQLSVDLEVLELGIQGAKDRLRDYTQALARAEAEAQTINEARTMLAEANAKLDPLMHRSACLSRIAKTFGPMEIQSYEIDSAGPEVSRLANELLFNCFGPRYSIKLVTQEMKTDGSGYKDEFDVSVYDQKYTRWVSIDDLSGGQKVIVSEALALAIALYNKEKNGVAWDTLFRDEVSSALDVENAPAYIRMLRQARSLGKFQRVYFISHQQFLENLADSIIRVSNGQLTVEA